MRALLLLALAPSLAAAQVRDAVVVEADSSAGASLGLFAFARAHAAPAASPADPPAAPAAAPAAPTEHVYGRTGLHVTLPAGWTGAPVALEQALPARASYAFTNDAAGHALAGVTLRVDVAGQLDALRSELWRRGQAPPLVFHGMEPVAPVAAPLAGTAFETVGDRTRGAVVLLVRGPSAWAVSVEAPERTWAAHRDAVLAVLAGVRVPEVGGRR